MDKTCEIDGICHELLSTRDKSKKEDVHLLQEEIEERYEIVIPYGRGAEILHINEWDVLETLDLLADKTLELQQSAEDAGIEVSISTCLECLSARPCCWSVNLALDMLANHKVSNEEEESKSQAAVDAVINQEYDATTTVCDEFSHFNGNTDSEIKTSIQNYDEPPQDEVTADVEAENTQQTTENSPIDMLDIPDIPKSIECNPTDDASVMSSITANPRPTQLFARYSRQTRQLSPREFMTQPFAGVMVLEDGGQIPVANYQSSYHGNFATELSNRPLANYPYHF